MLHLFSIFDQKAECFQTPYFAASRGTGVRMFHKLANDQNTIVGQYAADFTLFELGTFDDSEGSFELHDTPINLGLAITMQEAAA